MFSAFFFFNDTATTEIYTLSLHDALPILEGGGGGEEADVGSNFFRLFDDVVAADDGGSVGGLEDGSEHAESRGFPGTIGAEEAVNLAWLAYKTDIIDGADLAALLVLKALGQGTSFNH